MPVHAYDCKITTLNKCLKNKQRMSLPKMDVEGHESNVFLGSVLTIKKHKPLLVFECETQHLTRHTTRDVFNFLASLGYIGHFFSPSGLKPLSGFDPAAHHPQGDRFWDAKDYCNNFLFQHPDATR